MVERTDSLRPGGYCVLAVRPSFVFVCFGFFGVFAFLSIR